MGSPAALNALPSLGPTDALWAWAKYKVATRLMDLNLSRVGRQVYPMSAPQPEVVPRWPAILVTSEGERAQPLGGTTEHKDWLLPVRVFLADRDTALRNEREAEWLGWHEAALNALDQQKLGGVPGTRRLVYWCLCEPHVAYDHDATAYRYVVGSLLAKCYVRQPRVYSEYGF